MSLCLLNSDKTVMFSLMVHHVFTSSKGFSEEFPVVVQHKQIYLRSEY